MRKLISPLPNLFIYIVVLFFIASAFSSCGTVTPYYIPIERQKENRYYYPLSANAFMVSKKNDLAVSLQGNTETGGIQGAYMFANHFAIAASNMQYQKNADHNYYLFGLGYIQPFKNLQFETYSGFITGKLNTGKK